jgi:hypothetical protein
MAGADVSVSCYGSGGPWRTRGGYEPVGQTVCGLAMDEGSAEQPLMAPTFTLNAAGAGAEGIRADDDRQRVRPDPPCRADHPVLGDESILGVASGAARIIQA